MGANRIKNFFGWLTVPDVHCPPQTGVGVGFIVDLIIFVFLFLNPLSEEDIGVEISLKISSVVQQRSMFIVPRLRGQGVDEILMLSLFSHTIPHTVYVFSGINGEACFFKQFIY